MSRKEGKVDKSGRPAKRSKISAEARPSQRYNILDMDIECREAQDYDE